MDAGVAGEERRLMEAGRSLRKLRPACPKEIEASRTLSKISFRNLDHPGAGHLGAVPADDDAAVDLRSAADADAEAGRRSRNRTAGHHLGQGR